jgi:hypothetical protein
MYIYHSMTRCKLLKSIEDDSQMMAKNVSQNL